MDMQFFDNNGETPQPRDKVNIEALNITPYPDRFRVFIEVKVTPFRERPNLLLVARNSDGNIAAELNIIATMHANMEFTMHLRGNADPAGDYELTAELFYETRKPPQDKTVQAFTIPEVEDVPDNE